MIELTRKEHLVHLMQSSAVNLSTNDTRFIHNLQKLIVTGSPITTNQLELMNLLIGKYRRQLAKMGYSQTYLLELPWDLEVIASDPLYTEAHIEVKNGKIYFRAPFNKCFLSALLRVKTTTAFFWDKKLKRFESDFNTRALKFIVEIAPKYHSVVNHCSTVVELLNSLRQYDAVKYWTPTLVGVQNHLLIAATNESLNQALHNLKLELSPKTLLTLTEHGVNVDRQLIAGNKQLEFAAQFQSEVQSSDLDTVLEWLNELGCQRVFFVGNPSSKDTRKELRRKLDDLGIVYMQLNSYPTSHDTRPGLPSVVFQYVPSGPIAPSWRWPSTLNIKKIVKINNTDPIVIK